MCYAEIRVSSELSTPQASPEADHVMTVNHLNDFLIDNITFYMLPICKEMTIGLHSLRAKQHL